VDLKVPELSFRAMEKRKEPRTRTLKKARIVFNEGRSVIDCVVRNLSAHGALLVVHSLLGVPDTFELHIESDGSRRVAHTIWKREGKIGVEFQPPD
jgi:PilZ domain-containing protein